MAATTLLTSDQFLALPEEFDQNGNALFRELINGEVVTMPHAAQRHDTIRSNILEALIVYLREHRGLGLKAFPDSQFIVSNNNALIPDLSVLAISRLNTGVQKYVSGAPELAFEVVSPSESAAYLRMKTDAYLANGSRSVWIVFPEVRSVMIYTRDSVRELRGDQPVEDALLPGFSAPVSAFFDLT
ncbi:MAG TPA: Uma2 family endonuclease [Bryobacteraceae bacterium]|nr:Uma2 family endonuclease [Bryobacteraceae bacterium]